MNGERYDEWTARLADEPIPGQLTVDDVLEDEDDGQEDEHDAAA